MRTHFELNTGAKIPAVGFGTFQAKPDEVRIAVEVALRAGYRHIDCASIYGNEREVGEGIKASGVPREDIFITGKLWNNVHRPQDVEPALDSTLKDLGTSYLDLYLIHWPVTFKPGTNPFPLDKDGFFVLEDIPTSATWAAMEKLLPTGKVKAIGVSNFNIRRIEELLKTANVVPAVNQIEAHPYLQQPDLVKFCASKNILIEAYSPFGNNETNSPRAIDDPKVKEIADKAQIDAGQLLASWGVQRGTVVLPKSVTKHRIEGNLKVRQLADDVYGGVTALEKHHRYNFPPRWGYNVFDELTDDEVKRHAQDYAADNLARFPQ